LPFKNIKSRSKNNNTGSISIRPYIWDLALISLFIIQYLEEVNPEGEKEEPGPHQEQYAAPAPPPELPRPRTPPPEVPRPRAPPPELPRPQEVFPKGSLARHVLTLRYTSRERQNLSKS